MESLQFKKNCTKKIFKKKTVTRKLWAFKYLDFVVNMKSFYAESADNLLHCVTISGSFFVITSFSN